MTYRVLALDLDGTTLNSDHQIPPQVKEAINRIKDRVMVLLVTGRHHTAARPYYAELGLNTPIICCNGTYVYDYQNNSVLAENAIERANAKKFLDLAQAHRLNLVMYVTDKMVYPAVSPVVYMKTMEEWAQQCPAAVRPEIERIDSLYDEMEASRYIWKFVAEGDIASIEAFSRLPWVNEHFIGEKSWSNRIDFSRKGNTKGVRLAALLAQQNIAPAQVVAIGDNHNDISMLQLAGLGVAMANADEAVRQVADRVTRETNNGLGIGEIIAEYFPPQ
ncbi:Cof-type HAD-IIB family hydrolase [Affinibrenneria salicis]|uniref:Cof-type HAD-IIB family hydrolase n=1 Tax=Affinibrenneria salicis TaxID=2590031 RepID=A0A5J5FRZ6_9GAMM|nr:Cof-type HAD-IIB family hydrolase [Affinibrenneria salicis]KAA8996139.1 Cof-type HAD-IIB family hydrolase [Affinibrenneria salicis]